VPATSCGAVPSVAAAGRKSLSLGSWNSVPIGIAELRLPTTSAV